MAASPSDASALRLLNTKVWPQISAPPSARHASTTTLDIAQCHVIIKAIDRQRSLMMARPIVLALAETINE